MDKTKNGEFVSGGKIVRALLLICILQVAVFSSTMAELDSLENLKKYSIYIVENEVVPVQPSNPVHPYVTRLDDIVKAPLKKCPQGQRKDDLVRASFGIDDARKLLPRNRTKTMYRFMKN